MKFICKLFSFLLIIQLGNQVYCWSSEDLELFDLVESTSQKFYDVLGVDQKASASDIRKAYRRLSTLYHPDKNKSPDAEETFRKIAAIADVLRNEERRKKYDLILQTGLPDWREPIYYYRRVRNMGLLELLIFLFCLATIGQYLFAWSVYWEKKYEIEEMVLSKLKKKAKHQRKTKLLNTEEELATAEEIRSLPKPRCRDLFPVQMFYFIIHFIKSTPCYLKSCFENCRYRIMVSYDTNSNDDNDSENETQEVKQRVKKHIKPVIPDYSNIDETAYIQTTNTSDKTVSNGYSNSTDKKVLTESDLCEFKKALKKFPNGTLQRWEKISAYLNCSVNEVIAMAKQLKSQQFARNVPISLQGVTGTENEIYVNDKSNEEMVMTQRSTENTVSEKSVVKNGSCKKPLNVNNLNSVNDSVNIKLKSEKLWSQEEQQNLEIALQKFPKDTAARWDRIAGFIQTKTKEECIIRYKELAQLVKKKKDKES